MALCPRLCLSVTSRRSIETDGRNNLLLSIGLLSTNPKLCFKEILISTKIKALPSGTFFKLRAVKNFATAYRSSNVLSTCSRKVDAQSVINWTVVCQLS